jgi:hypothetical protein
MVLEIKPVRSFWLECKKALTDTQGFVDNFSGGTDDKCQRPRSEYFSIQNYILLGSFYESFKTLKWEERKNSKWKL